MPLQNSSIHVAVYGAAGHTARFILAEIARRGWTAVAVTREGRAPVGSGGEWRAAAVDDPRALERAFTGTRAVINCAGPFLDTAGPVVAAALRVGAHYLDLTAEQASAQQTLATADAAARAAGVAVMPAMGFYGGFGDLLVTAAMGDWAAADAVDLFMGLDRWHPTRGTRRTGERNTVPRLVVAGGRLRTFTGSRAERAWTFAPPLGRQQVVEVPFSETILIARHKVVEELHTYLSRVALDDLRETTTPPPRAVDAAGRSDQRFEVHAVIRRGADRRGLSARGRDIYAFTAPLAVSALGALFAGRFVGAHAPGAILNAREFLAMIAPNELELDFNPPAGRTA